MFENASGLKELRSCSVRWNGCTILYRMISMQLDAKKAYCRKRDPLHHPSSSDCPRCRRLWDTLCGATGVHISSKYLGIFTALRKRDASSACKWTPVHSFKVSSTRRGQPRFHCSQGFINKTGAATLSFQPKFHQQDGGNHAFIAAKVSSTRRGQPRFHCSRSFINKYIQTNIHSLTEDPCILYLFWDKPFTCSYTIITYAAG